MKDLSEQTYYEVLELTPGCAADALARAYLQAKERYGPGALATYALAEPSEAEALLRRVEEAFAVLSDPDRRRAYDAGGGFGSGGWLVAPAPVPESAAEPVAPASVPESVAPAPAVAPASVPESASESVAPVAAPVAPASVSESASESVAPASEPVAPAPAVAPASVPESASEPVAPASVPESASEPVAPASVPDSEESRSRPVRKTESDLPADAAVTGEALRRVREARGMSLKDVEGRTKIGHWHLENIERERYADLPAQVYLRGFLMSFARELKLDPVRVAKSYLEQMKVKSQAKPE